MLKLQLIQEMKNQPEKQDMLLEDLSALNLLLQLLRHPAAFLTISNQIHTRSTLRALEESSPKTEIWFSLGSLITVFSSGIQVYFSPNKKQK